VDVLRRRSAWLNDLVEPLSPTEAKILADRGRGMSCKEIAAQYKMSAHTVREHLRRIFNKTGATSSAAAFAILKAKI
jgi:DNA-binding CsgD family transcriptional regulator